MKMSFKDAKTVVLEGPSNDAYTFDRLLNMLKRRPVIVDGFMFDDGRRPMLRLTLGRPRKIKIR